MYGIVRMAKYHQNDVAGIEDHHERRATKSNTNPDIKREKSKNNYDLTGLRDFTLNSLIKKRLNTLGIKPSKNAVVMCELMFGASPEFFQNMPPNEVRSYFEKCLEYAKEQYGEDNIIAADVHLDEKTPHMHLQFIPITKDGRLCCKEIFDKKGLKKLQDTAHQKVFSSYGLERGEPAEETQRKHKDTQTLKRDTLQKEIDDLIQQKATLQKEIAELEKARNTDALYQARQHLSAISLRLNEMMTTIESNPELLQHYKLVAKELQEREEEREL